MNFLSKTRLSLILVLSYGVLLAQVKNLADTPQGKIVQAYIEAFNSGDEAKMKEFFQANIAPDALKERPLEGRIERYRTMKADIRSIALKDVLTMGEKEVAVSAVNGSGEAITLIFGFDAAGKMSQLRIDLGTLPPPATGPALSGSAALDSIKSYLKARVAADLFSGTVLIAKDSSIIFKQAYGYADKRFRTPNTLETKYNLGSINKYFTKLAIGQLAEAGKIALDTPFIKYLPDYPNRTVAEKVTARQLINMRSGMGDFFGEKYDETPKERIRTLSDYLRLFVDDPLEFEPATSERYSNAGYIVLGLIIEKVSGGEDYYGYVRKHIFAPAGMTNTDSYAMDGITPNMSTGYEHPGESRGEPKGGWVSNIYSAPGRGSSAGGGYSTVRDLFNFLQALRNGKLLSAKYSLWMLTREMPQADPELPLKTGAIGIAGGAPGINSAVDFNAESGEIVIVLGNYSPPAAMDVAKAIRGFLKRVNE